MGVHGTTAQWRFTPPTHVVAALRAALDQYSAEGGRPARLARYAENCTTLSTACASWVSQLSSIAAVQAPIIVTFHAPATPAYDFKRILRRVRDKGFILYPGKLTRSRPSASAASAPLMPM